ncbi:MAG: YbaB/EbfC family nucleoid-associated protein [Malacoplasma sp.]|nr:YbaB/EbfC family nucleoid-associated protein [Malacoplasma sp.]
MNRNMQKMLRDAKALQDKLDKKLKEFESEEFQFDYKNTIKIRILGSCQILKIEIDKQLIDPDDKSMLEEMVVEAINEAYTAINNEKEEITNQYMPNIPNF